MKRFTLIAFTISALVYNLYSCENALPVAKQVHNKVEQDIQDFQDHLKDSFLVLTEQHAPVESLREAFLHSRLLFKQFEWASEYYMPTTSRFVNGAPVPEIENEENKIMDPEGLQVIEGLLFPQHHPSDSAELRRQIRLLIAHTKRFKTYWEANEVEASQVFDAVKLEVFRIISLGLSGYDNAIAQNSIAEAAVALSSCKLILAFFGEEQGLNSSFDDALTYLATNRNFEKFDRLEFISKYANPVTTAIAKFQEKLSIAVVNDTRLLNPAAKTMFDKDAFNVNAYVQEKKWYNTDARAALGKKLFYDPVLSSSITRSCATCHNPSKAFTDGLSKSLALTTGPVKRNAPTLLNAALQPWQFYDMRATNLESQAQQVISQKDEMHGNLALALLRLRKSGEYQELFVNAYPQEKITEQHLQNALASYVRSLSLLNSRFDQFMRGEKNIALNAEERNGFNLFMGKAKCGTCHFMPLFNGTLPPAFNKMDSEVLGVPETKQIKKVDNDSGRYLIYRLLPYLYSFKTTTVRNTAITAPYMHNGVFDTLDEVIEFYNNGGGAGANLNVPTQTLPADSLNLTAKEKGELIAFIKTLNDEY